VSSRMFATLDPTIRALRLPSNRRVLVSDTVGFIRDLPKGLLTAFRATLEEVQDAALIVHVSDVSNPHNEELDDEVDKILAELNVTGRPKLHVLNKIDALTAEQRDVLKHRYLLSSLPNTRISGLGWISGDAIGGTQDPLPGDGRGQVQHRGASGDGSVQGPVMVSGLTGEGIEELLRRLDAALPIDPMVSLSLRMPLAEGRTLALIHALGKVLRSEVEDSHLLLDAEVPTSIAKRLRLSSFSTKGTSRALGT
jgi:GTPase